MSGKVVFAGAGPGAPDLITMRAVTALAEADAVIYAGSLVNEKILDMAPTAELYNSAKMSLSEVIELIAKYYSEGENVVRLHTGDPSMYGAVSEQYRELDKLGIDYEVIPGVSSVFAAAAALKIELTMPDLSQSVILTRNAGRTPVPERESIDQLAAHGTTMCLFLSVADMQGLCDKIIAAGRAPSTPAAVVYRASWENQIIVRGTLADIAGKTEEAGIKRQAMIVVGEVLDRSGGLSKLYDAEFTTGYRHSVYESGFIGSTAVFALTRNATAKAAEIAAGLNNAVVYAPEKYADTVSSLRINTFADGEFANELSTAWSLYDGFIMVMASGIAVRHIANLFSDKKTDPAVVVCDERGDYAVSLLSGHIGGANQLARDVAGITGGQAVITTASDVRKLPAFDEFAVRHHYDIINQQVLTPVASAVLENVPVELEMPQDLFEKIFAGNKQFTLKQERNDGTIKVYVNDYTLTLKKQFLVLGLGCRKGVAEERICEVVNSVLDQRGYSLDEVAFITSADVKQDEKGLLDFAGNSGKKIRFYSADKLNSVEVPNPSEQAEKHLGINSVSEASALLGAGKNSRVIIEKYADNDVTVALAGGVTHE